MTESSPSTKVCKACSQAKGLLEFDARRNTCRACAAAARERTAERKDVVAYTEALGERIVNMIASGMTVAQVCEQASMPTARQLRAWRRANPDFDAAYQAAEGESAAAHIDKAKEVLRKVEAGSVPATDGKVLFDGHVKLAATLNPSRYGTHASDLGLAKPLVDFASAIQALIDALPARVPALPAPEPLDVEATPVEGRTLQ